MSEMTTIAISKYNQKRLLAIIVKGKPKRSDNETYDDGLDKLFEAWDQVKKP